MGTFLVRSGVLTSVHSFAVDPARGVFILAIIGVFTGGALALFAWRAPLSAQGGLFAPISREGALVLNNLLLTTACAAVLIGTLYPLALEALTGDKISVGRAVFQSHLRAADGAAAARRAVRAVPRLEARRLPRRRAAAGRGRRVALAAAICCSPFVEQGRWLAPLGIGLGIWLIVGALSETAFRVKLFAGARRGSLAPPAQPAALRLGTTIAHPGSEWRCSASSRPAPGGRSDPDDEAGRDRRHRGLQPHLRGRHAAPRPNYREPSAIRVERDGSAVTCFSRRSASLRAAQNATTEAASCELARRSLSGARRSAKDGAYSVRLYFNPLVRLIWLGAVVMFFGGALSLSDRRLRVGAPARAGRRRHSSPQRMSRCPCARSSRPCSWRSRSARCSRARPRPCSPTRC